MFIKEINEMLKDLNITKYKLNKDIMVIENINNYPFTSCVSDLVNITEYLRDTNKRFNIINETNIQLEDK